MHDARSQGRQRGSDGMAVMQEQNKVAPQGRKQSQ
jgi:hypothetical protein